MIETKRRSEDDRKTGIIHIGKKYELISIESTFKSMTETQTIALQIENEACRIQIS